MSDHMKRLAMPRTWAIPRKVHVWAAKQTPGAHSVEDSMPAGMVLRDMLKVCDTAREAKKIIANRDMIVNGRKVKDAKAPVGIMDSIAIPKMNLYYRMLLTGKGKLTVVAIPEEEAKWVLCRVENKTKIAGGKLQLNLSGGRNIILDANQYKTGDSVKLDLEKDPTPSPRTPPCSSSTDATQARSRTSSPSLQAAHPHPASSPSRTSPRP